MRYILFDLDGTITDSGKGIKNSVKYALEKLNLLVPSYEELDSYIGPPLKTSFMKFAGLNEDQASNAVDIMREYYTEKGILENTLYQGIEETLKRLKEKGYQLAIATSKPEPFAKQVIENFELDKYFDFIGGSRLDNTRTNKAEVIEYVMENLGVKDKQNVIMVGDRFHDIEGAKYHNIKAIGVTYGYGTIEEFKQADKVAKDTSELFDCIYELIR